MAHEIHNQDHTERNFRLKMTPAYVLCSQIWFFLHKLDVTVTILVMDVSALCSSWGQNCHSQKWEKPQRFKENTWLMYNKWKKCVKMWWKSKTKQRNVCLDKVQTSFTQQALLNKNEVETFSRDPWLMVWVGSMSVASPECTPASSTCSVIAWASTCNHNHP